MIRLTAPAHPHASGPAGPSAEPSAANPAIVFRQHAWQADAAARRATDEVACEVFTLVAATWREIALDAARQHRRLLRSQLLQRSPPPPTEPDAPGRACA